MFIYINTVDVCVWKKPRNHHATMTNIVFTALIWEIFSFTAKIMWELTKMKIQKKHDGKERLL